MMHACGGGNNEKKKKMKMMKKREDGDERGEDIERCKGFFPLLRGVFFLSASLPTALSFFCLIFFLLLSWMDGCTAGGKYKK